MHGSSRIIDRANGAIRPSGRMALKTTNMNRFHFILLFLFLFLQTTAKEPSKLYVFKHREYLFANAFDLTGAEILDTTVFEARYTLSYQKEGWNKLSWGEGDFTLQVGTTWTKFYPNRLLEIDSIRTKMQNSMYTPPSRYPRIWTVYSAGDRNVT